MFLKILNILIIFNLFFMRSHQSAKRRFSFEFYSYTCQKFGKRFTISECSYTKYTKYHYAFSQKVQFDRDMAEEFQVRIWLEVKQPLAQKAFRFADHRIGACNALHHKYDIQILRTVISEIKRASNLPSQCPFKGGVLYEMKNFSLITTYLPAYFPACNFTFGVDFYDSSSLFGSTKISGSLVI